MPVEGAVVLDAIRRVTGQQTISMDVSLQEVGVDSYAAQELEGLLGWEACSTLVDGRTVRQLCHNEARPPPRAATTLLPALAPATTRARLGIRDDVADWRTYLETRGLTHRLAALEATYPIPGVLLAFDRGTRHAALVEDVGLPPDEAELLV